MELELDGVNIEVITRVELLTFSLIEFVIAFGARNECEETIKKGVFERQIIRTIILYYYDKNYKHVGSITMDIDWELHKLNVKEKIGDKIEVNKSLSILEQIDKVTCEIIKHVNRLRKSLDVTYIKSGYRYIEEIEKDPIKYKNAMTYLKHVEQDEKLNIDNKGFKEMTCVFDKLTELTISIKHR